jgi:hypothetical protein
MKYFQRYLKEIVQTLFGLQPNVKGRDDGTTEQAFPFKRKLYLSFLGYHFNVE